MRTGNGLTKPLGGAAALDASFSGSQGVLQRFLLFVIAVRLSRSTPFILSLSPIEGHRGNGAVNFGDAAAKIVSPPLVHGEIWIRLEGGWRTRRDSL